MNIPERRRALERIAADGRYAQFGQSHDRSTSNGSEACTHVCLQFLIKIWTGQDVTIDHVSDVAGYASADVGMNSSHIDRVIAEYDLPLVASWRSGAPSSATSQALISLTRQRGPALLAISYAYYPWSASFEGHLRGLNGYAKAGGRSDPNFDGDHAVLLLSAGFSASSRRYRPRLVDPDHGSVARPYVPPFDAISGPQLDVLWDRPLRARTSSGAQQRHVGYLPTKAWNGIPA